MKVAITGHTKGIGKALYDYFLKNNYEVHGFARTNGFNISKPSDRKLIVEQTKDFDIFINNAYNNFDNSQELLLRELLEIWKSTDKTIINVSSRWTTSNDNKYCVDKLSLDNLCNEHIFSNVHLINLKPGLTDTPRMQHESKAKMSTQSIVMVVDFILTNKHSFKVHSITFGK